MTSFLRRYFAGGGTTTVLANAMASGDASFVIGSATGWPGSPGTNFGVVIDRGTASEEKILCSSNASTTVTVATRGIDGTSATSHNAGATVSLCGLGIDFDEANQMANLFGNAAEGSLFYGKGAGTLPAKLAIGTNGQVLTSNGTDPVWSATPGSLSVTNFAPSSISAYNLNASSLTAIDTTNLTTSSFTVPSSGRIKVTLGLCYAPGGASCTVSMCMKNHSGGANVGPVITLGPSVNGVKQQIVSVWYITGLTPGGSLQLDLAGTYSPGGVVCSVSAQVSATPAANDSGPATIIIDAA